MGHATDRSHYTVIRFVSQSLNHRCRIFSRPRFPLCAADTRANHASEHGVGRFFLSCTRLTLMIQTPRVGCDRPLQTLANNLSLSRQVDCQR